MESNIKPYIVYFYPYEDVRFFEKQKHPQDYVCCVMAKDQKHAIEKTERIAVANGSRYIKIMGIANGRPEWVNEEMPLRYGRYFNE
jgi:hypothetical protein